MVSGGNKDISMRFTYKNTQIFDILVLVNRSELGDFLGTLEGYQESENGLITGKTYCGEIPGLFWLTHEHILDDQSPRGCESRDCREIKTFLCTEATIASIGDGNIERTVLDDDEGRLVDLEEQC